MKPIPSLSGSHLRTYTMLFQHPVSHNLAWHDVHALFRQIGEVKEEPNGSLKVTRHGESIVLHPARTKDVDSTEEMMRLRHFVERSEAATVAGNEFGFGHWLLVIDHHEARIFRPESAGAVTLQILPPPPDDFFRHAPDSKDFARGQEKPDPNSFFPPVVKALAGAGQILVFGTGTGKSSEMDQFVDWARVHHADLAARIVGTLVVDEHHLTAGQLLEKARAFFAKPQAVHA
jgi:hypothetical protein